MIPFQSALQSKGGGGRKHHCAWILLLSYSFTPQLQRKRLLRFPSPPAPPPRASFPQSLGRSALLSRRRLPHRHQAVASLESIYLTWALRASPPPGSGGVASFHFCASAPLFSLCSGAWVSPKRNWPFKLRGRAALQPYGAHCGDEPFSGRLLLLFMVRETGGGGSPRFERLLCFFSPPRASSFSSFFPTRLPVSLRARIREGLRKGCGCELDVSKSLCVAPAATFSFPSKLSIFCYS